MVLSLLLLGLPRAHAGVTAQVAPSVIGHAGLTEKLDARAATTVIWALNDHPLVFVYGGVRWQATPHFSVAPQIGAIANWYGIGDVSPALATVATYTIDRTLMIIDAEVVFTLFGPQYFGSYVIDYAIHPITVGAQIEQRNFDVGLGPHVGLEVGPHLYLGFEYYVSTARIVDQTFRTAIMTSF